MLPTQTCPSCHNSKSTNSQLRFLVNVCGHILCENCVETLFVRGSGLCVTCNTPIRKVNFRFQLFEDPFVQKEVEIRKKILYDFNKRESDFNSLGEYDLYLEKIEEIIYNLTNDINLDETRKFIETYKRENKDAIKRNRIKPPDSVIIYNAQLNKEKETLENLKRIDNEEFENWRKSRLERRENKLKGALGEFVQSRNSEVPKPSNEFKQPTVPPSISFNESSKKFIPPPSSMGFRAPPSARQFGIPPSSMIPGSAGFITPASNTQWAQNPVHHNITMIPPTFVPTQHIDGGGGFEQLKRLKDDQLFLDSNIPAKMSRAVSGAIATSGPYEHQTPKPLIFGPDIPNEQSARWNFIKSLYDLVIIDPMTVDVSRGPVPEDFKPGMSDSLPIGACGLNPLIFLHRALQESRCALFLKSE